MDKSKIRTLNKLYRNVFDTPEGRMVLQDILKDTGYFNLFDVEDKADIARLNVGRRILGKCGIFEECYSQEIVNCTLKADNSDELLDSFFRLPIPNRGDENDN